MKRVMFLIGLFSLSLNPFAYSQEVMQDSVVVNFGTDSRVIFLIRNEKDYKQLSKMDLNQIAKDISQASVGEGESFETQTLIGSESSNIYVVRRVKPNDEETIYVRLGSLELDLKSDVIQWGDGNSTYTNTKVEGVRLNVPGQKREKPTRSFIIDLGVSTFSSVNAPDMSNNQAAIDRLGNQFQLGPDQHRVRPWGSWYFAMGYNNRTRIAGPLAINYGGTFSWYNFKFQDRATTLLRANDEIFFAERLNVDPIKSKLSVSHVNIHFVPTFDFRYGRRYKVENDGVEKTYYNHKRHAFRVGAGPYVGHRLGGRAKYRFRDEDGRQRIKDDGNFFYEDLRYGVRGLIGWRQFDMFVNYDLNHVFSKNRGPEMRAISFGLIL